MSIEAQWQRLGPLAIALWPVSLLFRLVVASRRWAYRRNLLKSKHPAVPVIVVGNITVGGSGKTPLVIWLVEFLRGHGLQPGVVSRGYGGGASHWPQQVGADSDPVAVGDEAVLLAQRAACPVCVGPDRPAAIDALLQHSGCDVVVSDDGLQHYAMSRDIEIAVIDGQRRFGNGLMLPAGPLREPVSRLRDVDLVICNGQPQADEFAMQLSSPQIYRLDGEGPSRDISVLEGQRVRAIAGIGNPGRFFDMLRSHGLVVQGHAFPDHHAYTAEDLAFAAELPLLMTEKDAVKCRNIFAGDAWVVSIQAQPEAPFVHRLSQALAHVLPGESR